MEGRITKPSLLLAFFCCRFVEPRFGSERPLFGGLCQSVDALEEDEVDVDAGVAAGELLASALVEFESLDELESLAVLDDSFEVDFDPRLSFL
jgi:hypothetical protein